MAKRIIELSDRLICIIHYEESVSGICKKDVDEYLEMIHTVVGYKKNNKIYRYHPSYTKYEFIPTSKADEKKLEWPSLTEHEWFMIDYEKSKIKNSVRNRTITFDEAAQEFYL